VLSTCSLMTLDAFHVAQHRSFSKCAATISSDYPRYLSRYCSLSILRCRKIRDHSLCNPTRQRHRSNYRSSFTSVGFLFIRRIVRIFVPRMLTARASLPSRPTFRSPVYLLGLIRVDPIRLPATLVSLYTDLDHPKSPVSK